MRFPSRWMQADLPRAAATAAMLLALAASGAGLGGCSTAPADPSVRSASTPAPAQQADALPSWRDGPAKQAIVKFCLGRDAPGLAHLRAARAARGRLRQ